MKAKLCHLREMQTEDRYRISGRSELAPKPDDAHCASVSLPFVSPLVIQHHS